MFQIDPFSRVPVYEQIVEQTERFVLLGVMLPGDPMPSVRNLSVQLKANPNTIQKAYSELDARKVLYSVPGKGCFISADAPKALKERERVRLKEFYELCSRLRIAGVTEKDMIDTVRSVFGDGGEKHDNG